ncbi:hypothetical protein DSM106972_038920 [Dulcicalothrix desertica PCC 7102]|uniref:Uncharacterized protein n=1 Tax=Dulcicalothrix desertica PCC 7102 TaxID=232991 RepID=A0A433VG51_9CYAN|nr:hypothetical protein [Dulcicalothrix desertica]RUT05071.1 hypothetical protein DSM106972_038920 [Dulcicalothrix desertica PCC 7102]TWH62612.1 hypothetical protein CAL7102_00106 [Dulcicalothrix desertica PCC 7102]
MNTVKALPALQGFVQFGNNITIDAFLLSSGEIRYSKTGAARLLRKESTWINGLESKTPELLKLLLDKGYTGWSQRVSVKREGKRGTTIAETISGDDLDILVAVEAERGNKKAAALLVSGWRQYRIDQSRRAFRLSEREQSERLNDFEQWHDAYLANQEDWEVIAEQEQFLLEPALNFTVDDYDSDPECYQVPFIFRA